MPSGKIALLRRHGRFQLGMLWSSTDGKLWAIGGDGAPFRLNRQQTVWETDIPTDDSWAAAWITECEALAHDLDLQEVWQVVQGEVPWLSLKDLGELVLGGPPDDRRVAALLMAVHGGQVSYFAADEGRLVPRPPEDVEAQVLRQEQALRTAEDEQAFLRWLDGEADLPGWTDRQRESLALLRQYAIHGESAPVARHARRLLRQVRPDTSDRQWVAFTVLVERGVFDEDEPLGLHRLGIPMEFDQDVLVEAQRLADALHDAQVRRDLTALHVVTIDEATTADMDDGMSVQAQGDGHVVGIHISDVAALIPPECLVDQEARARATSLYLPERVIPMLPPSLSREAGSLTPGVPRRALSLLVRFDGDLGITGWEIVPSIVESKARLSYEEAELILESPDHALASPLRLLRAVADRLKEQRLQKGALELDRPEVKVSVDGEGRITVGVVERPTEARGLVAEFMILANRLMAEYCRDHAIPAVYRTQGAVSLEGLLETSVEAVRQFQIFRRVRPAGVTTTPGPHALLGLDVYLQATSPIRRYTDLVAQRQVAHHMSHGEPLYDLKQVEEMLQLVGQGQRDRGRAETARKQYWLLKAMSACVGEVFPAVVLDLRDRHALLELEPLQLRTTVYVAPGVGVGQTVALRLRDVNLWNGQPSFTHEPDGADPGP